MFLYKSKTVFLRLTLQDDLWSWSNGEAEQDWLCRTLSSILSPGSDSTAACSTWASTWRTSIWGEISNPVSLLSIKAAFNSSPLMSLMMFSLYFWSFRTWWRWRGLKEARQRPGRKAVPVQRPRCSRELARGSRPCWRCLRSWSWRWTGSSKRTAVSLPSDLQVMENIWNIRKFWKY